MNQVAQSSISEHTRSPTLKQCVYRSLSTVSECAAAVLQREWLNKKTVASADLSQNNREKKTQSFQKETVYVLSWVVFEPSWSPTHGRHSCQIANQFPAANHINMIPGRDAKASFFFHSCSWLHWSALPRYTLTNSPTSPSPLAGLLTLSAFNMVRAAWALAAAGKQSTGRRCRHWGDINGSLEKDLIRVGSD